MIYTLTLNPALDYYMTIEDFKLGGLNSLKTGYITPGGKGINVSKVLKNFGVESFALGFAGGFTGDYILKDLNKLGIKNDFTELKDNTRINIKLKTNEVETEIAGNPPHISQADIQEILSKFEKVKSGDIVVLSGSVPKSVGDDIYAEIIKIVPNGVKVILDTRGDAFTLGIAQKVFLTKPNNHELEEFFKRELKTTQDIIRAGKELQRLGSENVLISLGKEGSILITKDKVFVGNAPSGKLISSVGAGDSMVAGIVYGISQNYTLEDTYKCGIASGSSTAFSKELTTYEDMKKLLTDVKIKIWEGTNE